MQFDWTNIAAGFSAGAFPWISQLKSLPIHFKLKDLELSAIFNFFASLFSFGIYFYCVYAHPTQVAQLPAWYLMVGIAFLLTVAFFALFVSRREAVKDGTVRWPVYVNFPLYVLIFATLTIGFGKLKLLSDYVVITGVVTDDQGIGLGETDIEVIDLQKHSQSAVSDRRGRFQLLVTRSRADSLFKAQVSKQGWCDRQITFSDAFSAPSGLRHIKIRKMGVSC